MHRLLDRAGMADAAPRTAAELHALLDDGPVTAVSHGTSNGSGSEGAATS